MNEATREKNANDPAVVLPTSGVEIELLSKQVWERVREKMKVYGLASLPAPPRDGHLTSGCRPRWLLSCDDPPTELLNSSVLELLVLIESEAVRVGEERSKLDSLDAWAGHGDAALWHINRPSGGTYADTITVYKRRGTLRMQKGAEVEK